MAAGSGDDLGQSPAGVGASGGGTTINGSTSCAGNGGCVDNPNLITFGGQKWPDIVGALHVKQGWGEAQLSGVVHNVNVSAIGFDNAIAGENTCGTVAFPVACNGEQNHVGWAIDAGVKINLQGWGGMFGSGDDLIVTGVYSQSAVWYSGLLDGMWGENGQTNGNGQPMFLADAFFNPINNQWSTRRAWSVSTLLEHHWTPTIYTDLEGSIGGVQLSNMAAAATSGCRAA